MVDQPAGATPEVSPLDELHISADQVWTKVCPGYVLTDEDIATLVRADRANRETFVKKSTTKKLKKEAKEVEAEGTEE